ncbi:BTB domain-containing protein [Mycena venus]|uniref:BTB domain-containing protein n=1 Tax=Mycena venus TaxID=2733690 RepID=A0A8H7D824_9AGAR|nr:BTB domain-containing protein [Mycena venus]
MSELHTSPAKRQRTEDASTTRSDVWYKDGSVVLQAQKTQFRVHLSVLCQHSSVFGEMQSLPQPPDQPCVDGCPVIELPDDAAADVEHLLRVLYNMKIMFQPVLPFAVVAAVIRVGRKYDFRDLLDLAVERVTFENPTTLDEFDAQRPTRIEPYPGIAFDMLALARENHILSALPVAHYRAAVNGLVGDFSWWFNMP